MAPPTVCTLSLCRYIELSNGLRALLISDFSQTGGTGGSKHTKNGTERADGEEEEQRDDEGHCGEEEGSSEKQVCFVSIIGLLIIDD